MTRVLMISLDQGLLGLKRSGDVVVRHARYGEAVARLDIIVFASMDRTFEISDKVSARSTISSRTMGNVINGYRAGSRLSRREPYDLIVTQDPMFTGLVGWLLKLRFGSKLLVHLHGDFFGKNSWYRRSPGRRLRLTLARLLVRRADGIRVMSGGQKEYLVQSGVDSRRIRVISTPVDIDRYMKGAQMDDGVRRWPERGWTYTVLMVGRKDPVKDFDTLFKAMARVFESRTDVGLWLVGNYGDTADVPLPPDRVLLTPNLPAEEMPECYRKSDMVVLSSRSESFGKVLVEANASGKPVIATATAGAREIIEDGVNGYLVPIGGYEELALRVVELLRNPELARRLGENGRAAVNTKYGSNSDKVVEYWNEIVCGVCNG